MKIVVLAGGYSPERDVSLASGSLIANALLDKGHQTLLLDLYLGMEWDGKDADSLFLSAESKQRYHYEIPTVEPDLKKLKEDRAKGDALIGPNVLSICREADVVFLALHGGMGENGQLQAVLDSYAIPYTGSGYAGCLLAMDKDITKQLLRRKKIPTADWETFYPEDQTDDCFEKIEYPCVVKPLDCGSSIGISFAENVEELKNAVALARNYCSGIMVEKVIKGREFSVGILGEKALPVIEIIPKQGFYDYTNKYQPGLTEEICPADLSDEDTCRVQKLAEQVHKALRLSGYSRIDFIRDDTGVFYCLEANTLPGMTPTSLLPQEAAAVGISYEELCQRLAEDAWKKNIRK